MLEDKSFKILIAGLDGVGKHTIIQKFNEGYQEFKQKVLEKEQLRDGEDKLIKLDIQLVSHTITSRAIDDDEYISKKDNDLNQYKIIVIVFDLGQKDSIKEIAQTIQGSSLNFSKLDPTSKCALWGNKKDKFNFNGDVDERTAQKVYELERDLMMVGYVKCNATNLIQNEPFQNISKLIQEYLRWIELMSQSNYKSQIELSTYSDLSQNRQQTEEEEEICEKRKTKKGKKFGADEIASLKCGSEKEIQTRPKNQKKKKKMDEDIVSGRSGTKNCAIF